jgi:hypothetical protein
MVYIIKQHILQIAEKNYQPFFCTFKGKELLCYKIQVFLFQNWNSDSKEVIKMPMIQFTCERKEAAIDENTPESLSDETLDDNEFDETWDDFNVEEVCDNFFALSLKTCLICYILFIFIILAASGSISTLNTL